MSIKFPNYSFDDRRPGRHVTPSNRHRNRVLSRASKKSNNNRTNNHTRGLDRSFPSPSDTVTRPYRDLSAHIPNPGPESRHPGSEASQKSRKAGKARALSRKARGEDVTCNSRGKSRAARQLRRMPADYVRPRSRGPSSATSGSGRRARRKFPRGSLGRAFPEFSHLSRGGGE